MQEKKVQMRKSGAEFLTRLEKKEHQENKRQDFYALLKNPNEGFKMFML